MFSDNSFTRFSHRWFACTLVFIAERQNMLMYFHSLKEVLVYILFNMRNVVHLLSIWFYFNLRETFWYCSIGLVKISIFFLQKIEHQPFLQLPNQQSSFVEFLIFIIIQMFTPKTTFWWSFRMISTTSLLTMSTNNSKFVVIVSLNLTIFYESIVIMLSTFNETFIAQIPEIS